MQINRWIALAGIEALVIAAFMANTLLRASEDTVAQRSVAGCQEDIRSLQPPQASKSTDTDALRSVIRSELAVVAATTRAPLEMPPVRDAALDQLRRSALHRQIEDHLRRGEIHRPELEAFQEQAMLLEARESDVVLGRLFRAINLGQLRLSPSTPPQTAAPEHFNDVQ